jgi:cell division septation protein DedD
MPVRCPACHSDQTKPAPPRNFLERMGGLLGRRAYFCEDCYRRFTPSGSSAPPPEEAPPPAAEIEEGPSILPAPAAPPVSAPPEESPPQAQAVAMDIPQEEDSLISRLRRQQLEENEGNDDSLASDKSPGFSLPLSPVKLAAILGGALLLIVLILWYRSHLEQAPVTHQAPTTRLKISEGTSAQTPEGAAGSVAPVAPVTPSQPSREPAATLGEQMPARVEPPAPAPLAMPQEPAVLPLPPTSAPPAPSRRRAQQTPAVAKAPAVKAPVAKAPATKTKPTAIKPSPPQALSQGGYAVQFGAFSQASRAQVLVAKLQAKGLKVQVVSVKGRDGKTWHKVRSGGLASQDEAQRVQRKLEQASGIKGMVVRLKP